MLLGICASHSVLPLEFKPPHSLQSPARLLGSGLLRTAFAPCEDRPLRAVSQLQLALDVAYMACYRVRADHQLLGNLTVALSRGDEG
jgi:hypothetical protein